MNPTFFLGHHKSGTRYIGSVLENMCHFVLTNYAELNNPKWFGFDVINSLQTKRPLFVKYMNANYEYIKDIGEFRAFHVIRDPRDLAISAYFSHRYSHSTDWWPELAPHRERLSRLDFAGGLLADMEFTDELPTDGFPITVFPAMDRWNYADERILELHFEDFVRAPIECFIQAFTFIGLIDRDTQAHLDRIEQLVQRYAFEKVSGGRRRGETDDRHHYRSGTPGEWRNRLEPIHLRWFEKRYPELLRRFDGRM